MESGFLRRTSPVDREVAWEGFEFGLLINLQDIFIYGRPIQSVILKQRFEADGSGEKDALS